MSQAGSPMPPAFYIALTPIYYDQRVRREGFDIEMMTDVAGMNEAATAISR